MLLLLVEHISEEAFEGSDVDRIQNAQKYESEQPHIISESEREVWRGLILAKW
jgi:hypothetical protein